MDCFEILGIEPTNNIRIIKKAYSLLLKRYHPEEYPEEFKKIHQAYEEALLYARNVQDNDIEELYIQDKDLADDVIKNTETKNFETKFKKVEEYEIRYTQKEIDIAHLIEMMELQKIEFGSPQKTIFNTLLFLKYCFDPLFIEKYIQAIHDGLYDQLNSIEIKRLSRVHKKLYFSNMMKKREYQSLYNTLYPYLFNKIGQGKELIIFILILFITIITYDISISITVFWIELFLLIIYTVIIPNRISKNSTDKSVKRFLLYRKIIISLYTCILVIGIGQTIINPQGNANFYEEKFDDFGQYDYNIITDQEIIELKQLTNQYATVKNYGEETLIQIDEQKYIINHSYKDFQDFTFYNQDIFYIYSHNIYSFNSNEILLNIDQNALKYKLISSDNYCLFIEETSEKVNIFEFIDNKFKKIYSSHELFGRMDNRALYLHHHQLYHYKESSQYLWCFDMKTVKDQETYYNINDLKGIDFIDNEIFLNYDDNPHLLDGWYDFHGKVLYFVDLGNGHFCYVNELGILYIVDNVNKKEIIGMNLKSICNNDVIDIESIVGYKNHLVIKYGTTNILELDIVIDNN